MARVSLVNLVKRFDDTEVVRGIDLDIRDQEFVVLVGPSGCGKSTTLRMVAGLEEVSGGEIIIGNKVVNSLAPKDRDIAMVFQNYALYPHMKVRQNLAFGLRLRKHSKDDIERRVQEAANMLGIDDLLDRRPRQLSGGQRQRVAMGRAIVRDPDLFLFDEPLSNLDAKLRVKMRTEMKKLHQKLRTTTIYVTHDQIEAMTLADRVVVMNDGRIEQFGPPDELYHRPRTMFVAGFIGSPGMNFLPCRLEKGQSRLVVNIGGGPSLPVSANHERQFGDQVGKDLLFGLRPEHISEFRADAGLDDVAFDARLDVVEPMGMETMLFFSIGGNEVCARVKPKGPYHVGSNLRLVADMQHLHLIDPQTELVL